MRVGDYSSPDEEAGPTEAIRFGLPLVVALSGLVPLIAHIGLRLGVGRVPVLLGSLVVVGAGYLLFITSQERFVAGLFFSLFVLTTYAANLPLSGDTAIYRATPGTLGPNLWLFHGPLVLVTGYFLWRRQIGPSSLRTPEILYSAFSGWTVLSALFGAGPRTDVALYFSQLILTSLVILIVVRQGVERRIVNIEAVLTTYIIALGGHLAFGSVQVVNQRPLGMTFMGEGITWSPPVSVIPGITYQLIPSGLTGHGYVLVALILLLFPSLLVFLDTTNSKKWIGLFGLATLATVVLRLTTSDAGRGAFLVISLCLVVGTVLLIRDRSPRWVPSDQGSSRITNGSASAPLRSSLALVVGVVVILLPSSRSGSSVGADSRPGLSANGDPSTPASSDPTMSVEWIPDSAPLLESLPDSLPLFDLSTLGLRGQQYAIGLDLFVRYPIFGVGGGNYRFLASRYGIESMPGVGLVRPIHNVYIMLLAETGIIGFLLFFGTIGLVAYNGLQSVLDHHKPRVVGAVLVGFIGVGAFAFFTHLIDTYTVLLPFWALAGATLGERYSKRTDR